MHRPPLLQTENAWWVGTLALILSLAFAPSLPAATVITGDVTPALPWNFLTDPRIGNTGAGTLAVDGGSQLNSGVGYLGDKPGSTGTATITGGGSTWFNNKALSIGLSGNGLLHVEAGGQVSSSAGSLGINIGSTGTATISGVGSKWTSRSSLFVGSFGSGTLTVEDGGHVSADTLYASLGDLHGDGTIASTRGAVLDADLQFDAAHPSQNVFGFGAGGTLTVTAAGGDLGAGYRGLGNLTISEGVAVVGSYGYLGFRSGSTGTARIVGAGSKWTSNSVINVGHFGSGSLRVEAGGQVSSPLGALGIHSGATGMATITGAGSKWTNIAELWVGNNGSGSLRVEAGGLVSNGYGFLGARASSMGTATISGAGSSWTNSSALYVGFDGSGAIRVEAGGLLSSPFGHLGYNAGSMGTATIIGAGSKWTINSPSSALVVGRIGSGALTITAGGLVSVRGMLTIDSNGGNDGFVNLATGGMLALWGDADDSLAQFLGLVDGTDAIRYWSASSAGWAPLTAAAFGVDYTLQYQTTGDLTGYTLLTVLALGPPGDFNYDGRVDGDDLLAWQRNHAVGDLADWRGNFGAQAVAAVTSSGHAAPEPSSLAMLIGAFAWRVTSRSARGRPTTGSKTESRWDS